MEIRIENARNYLIESISNLIDEISKDDNEYLKMFKITEEKNEQKKALIKFLNKIKDKDEIKQNINKKLLGLNNLDDHDYELSIDMFLEKFKLMIDKISEKEKYDINYYYFYEDLILTIYKLLIINNLCDLLLIILNKVLSKTERNVCIGRKTIEIINKENISILNMLSNTKILCQKKNCIN